MMIFFNSNYNTFCITFCSAVCKENRSLRLRGGCLCVNIDLIIFYFFLELNIAF